MSGYTLIHTHKHINKHTRSHRLPHESVQTQVFLFTKNSYTRYISSQIHAYHAPYIPRKEHKIQASGEGSININKSPKGIPWKNGVSPMFPRPYIPRVLCSPVLYSPVPMFPRPKFPSTYIPRVLCYPELRLSCVPRVLCSPVPMFPQK